jgi:TolB-like protein/DNA-binding winged helix-turn-helix (wHTH) protein/cytochrome c-type biogenesis protein CcmH/NrfG
MQKYRFGDFELNLDVFELTSRGMPIKLERRPLDLLALLVKQADRVVPREEIIAALWPTNVVIDFDSGLNTLVRKVRAALDDTPENPKFIETVAGRGYRFIAPIVAVTDVEPIRADAPMKVQSARDYRSSKLAVAAALSVAALGLIAWFAYDREPAIARIAVLPFENLTGDEELAYLASGLAEDTSTSLAQVDPNSLRVVGLSASALANTEPPLGELGRTLGVDYVVASSLRLDRTRLRVTSRLLRVSDAEQVWSASIDRELTNVLGLQRELSIALVEQIRQRLSPEVAAAIDRRQTQNPEAYALYLKGRYEWLQLTPASMRRALQYFDQAATEDPSYALAWAGIAFAAITSVRTADADPNVAKPIALQALEQAERLGPDLAETQYARGYYALFGDLDSREAAKIARVAIALDPNNAQAHMLLAMALMLDQRVEALEMMRRARELDPMFALAFANSANAALAAGDIEGGLEFSTQTIAINPEFWLGHYYLGRARNALGDAEGALRAYSDAARLSDGHSLTYQARAALLVELGRMDETQALLAEMAARAERQYVPAYSFAVVNALLGDVNRALDWLARAVEARDVGLSGFATDTRLRSLHGDPRFDALVSHCDCNPAGPHPEQTRPR